MFLGQFFSLKKHLKLTVSQTQSGPSKRWLANQKGVLIWQIVSQSELRTCKHCKRGIDLWSGAGLIKELRHQTKKEVAIFSD